MTGDNRRNIFIQMNKRGELKSSPLRNFGNDANEYNATNSKVVIIENAKKKAEHLRELEVVCDWLILIYVL